MINEQCIEVAEKVWGWKLVPTNFDDPEGTKVWVDDNNNVHPTFGIGDKALREVNSWQGFGRTMEAMRGHPERHTFHIKLQVATTGYLAESTGQSILFEATHLAALEAITND